MTASKNDWKETKEKIKTKFGKLSDSEIDGLKDNMDQLSSTIQKVYQFDKVKAEAESKRFTDSLRKN